MLKMAEDLRLPANHSIADLDNDNVYTKFGLILSISSQEKPNSDINQGP